MNAAMYLVYFEARVHLHGKPIGRMIELPDPDVLPASNDEEAIKRAFDQADVVESLKSLRIRPTQIDKKLLVRVKTIVRKGIIDEVILAPKYRGTFKHRA